MERSKSHYLFLLIIGLILYVVSALVISIYRLPIHWAIGNEFTALPSFYFFLIVIIVGPLWEEFVFRFSLTKTWWINKIILILYAVINYLLLESLILALVLIVAAVGYNIFFKKNSQPAQLFLIVFSTLGWAFIHFSQAAPNQMAQILNVTAIVGLGLIFAFVRLRFSFLAVLLVHIFWNSLAVFGTYLMAPQNFQVEQEDISINLTKHSFLNTKDGGSSIINGDSKAQVTNANLTDILESLLEATPTKNYQVLPTYAKYSGTFKLETAKPDQVGQLFNLTVDSANSLTDGYYLEIETIGKNPINDDIEIKYSPELKIVRNSIKVILMEAAKPYQAPVNIVGTPNLLDKIVTVQYSANAKNFEEVAKEICTNIGISLKIQPKELNMKTYYFY